MTTAKTPTPFTERSPVCIQSLSIYNCNLDASTIVTKTLWHIHVCADCSACFKHTR